MDKLEKGRLGEDAVCGLLLQRGHEIIARNYQQAKIIRTADLWLSDNDTVLQPRYDIAEVTLAGSVPRVVSIHIYEDAFTADGVYTVN